MERDRTQRTIPRLEEGNDYWFQVAAFSLVDGEHYMIGPRSPAVKAGKGENKVFRCCTGVIWFDEEKKKVR